MEGSIIKKYREDRAYTQDHVAEMMEVSTNTIQNWERGSNISSDMLHKLLDVYKVTDAERALCVQKIYGRETTEESFELFDVNPDDSEFPYFLFEEDSEELLHAREMHFNDKEQEVFGYLYHFGGEKLDVSCVPYECIKDMGGLFKVEYLRETIIEKTNCFNLDQIYRWCSSHPGINYDVLKLSSMDLKDLELSTSNGSEFISKRLFEACHKCNNFMLGDTYHGVNAHVPNEVRPYINIPDRYYSSNKTEYSIREGYERFFRIEQLEDTSDEYLEKKAQYESDLKAYNEHSGLYDHEPEFELSARWILYVTDLGKKFVEWYVKGTVLEDGEKEI